MRLQQVLSVLAPFAAAMLLSACNGLGDGARPESLEIQRDANTSLLGFNSNKVITCFPDQFQAVLTQSSGSQGFFTSRVKWTSSNPEVAQVSNGDIARPDDATLFFPSGVVIPKKTGTATIGISFGSLSSSFDIAVERPDSIELNPVDPVAAFGTAQQMQLDVKIGPYTRTANKLTSAISWSFDESAADEEAAAKIATFASDAPGLALINKTTGTLTARATLLGCPNAGDLDGISNRLSTSLATKQPSSITVTRDFAVDGQPIPALVAGTTEGLVVTAHFDGTDKTQDVTILSGLTSDNTAVAGQSSTFGIRGLKDGTANLTPRYPSTDLADITTITGAPLPVTVVTRVLGSVAITPDAPTMPALGTQQFRAIATYQDGNTQDITRDVTWSVVEASDWKVNADVIGSVSNSTGSIGLATSTQSKDGALTIKATVKSDTSITDTTPLTIKVPAP